MLKKHQTKDQKNEFTVSMEKYSLETVTKELKVINENKIICIVTVIHSMMKLNMLFFVMSLKKNIKTQKKRVYLKY